MRVRERLCVGGRERVCVCVCERGSVCAEGRERVCVCVHERGSVCVGGRDTIVTNMFKSNPCFTRVSIAWSFPPTSVSYPTHPRPELSLTCGTDVIQESIVFIRSELGTREDDSVEGNVVLGHELVELNLLGILPPFLPVFCVAGRD